MAPGIGPLVLGRFIGCPHGMRSVRYTRALRLKVDRLGDPENGMNIKKYVAWIFYDFMFYRPHSSGSGLGLVRSFSFACPVLDVW